MMVQPLHQESVIRKAQRYDRYIPLCHKLLHLSLQGKTANCQVPPFQDVVVSDRFLNLRKRLRNVSDEFVTEKSFFFHGLLVFVVPRLQT